MRTKTANDWNKSEKKEEKMSLKDKSLELVDLLFAFCDQEYISEKDDKKIYNHIVRAVKAYKK